MRNLFKNLLNVSAFISDIFGVTLVGGLILIVKYVTNFMKRVKGNNLAMTEAVKSLLHNSIYTLANDYIERGYITPEEYRNLHALYSSYLALGGTGVLIDLFEKVKNLEWKCGEDHE